MPKVDIAAPHVGDGVVCIRLYAGNSEYPALLAARLSTGGSENATGADNQQERPARQTTRAGILRDHTPEVRDTGS